MMVPKIIHLCWFSGDSYPVEIKRCLNSWRRILPDYEIKVWTEADARALDIPYVNQALDARRWAFASDVVRFYAVWRDGGVYMDSDIMLFQRFDDLIADEGLTTFLDIENRMLQAAIFFGSKGNKLCEQMVNYYKSRNYVTSDGTRYEETSPEILGRVAKEGGYQWNGKEQQIPGYLTAWSTRYLMVNKSAPRYPETVGMHMIRGSWRKRKLGRRIEIMLKHYWSVFSYYVRHKR